jgi:hypothetical protein
MKRNSSNQLSLFDEEPPCTPHPSSTRLQRPEPRLPPTTSPRSTDTQTMFSSPRPTGLGHSAALNGTEYRPDLAVSHREGLMLQIRRDMETLTDPVYAFDHAFITQRIAEYRVAYES